jgi:ribonuclease BN (tRNA processing enzyme)
VLTHLVPAPSPDDEAGWVERARAHFDGTVVVARDLLSLDVGA